eukprot:TRINITY_DN85577_c0_g1_i1.p1 TRINITY_DN85577_c0_g1~~TRINITY_DN85577_c0_g1_i1.p1  ORF type:complete len:285 (+),score=51.02 TRINITY_DN85577_c0_g1_i1:25-855(+)
MAMRFAGARTAAARGRARARARSETAGLHRVPASEWPRPQSAPARRQAVAQRRATTDDSERYLWRFGFGRGPPAPELRISMAGHEEVLGHTMYAISCSLRRPPKEEGEAARIAEWSCQKRLCDLREELHCRIKAEMGSAYAAYFESTPFARHGGVPGTTDRLRSWFGTLAACVNSSQLTGDSLAFLLRFLKAPVPEDSEAELLVRAGRCVVCTLPTEAGDRLPRCQPGEELPQRELCRRCQSLRSTAVSALRTRSQSSGDLENFGGMSRGGYGDHG